VSDLAGLHKLNPGLPRTFLNEEEAQDWLPFGATDYEMALKRRQDPNRWLEWAHWYNAWEEKGRDV
jgi:hypothetical protein